MVSRAWKIRQEKHWSNAGAAFLRTRMLSKKSNIYKFKQKACPVTRIVERQTNNRIWLVE